MGTVALTPQAVSFNGRELAVGNYITVPVVVQSTTGSGPSATVTVLTQESGMSLTLMASDLGASVIDAYFTQTPQGGFPSQTPQPLARTGRPVQTGDSAVVVAVITSISAVNGSYGSNAQVQASTLGSSTSITIEAGDIAGSQQTL